MIDPTKILAGAVAIYENIWDNLAEDIKFIDTISSDQESLVYFEKAKIKSEEDGVIKGLEQVRTNSTLSLKKSSQFNESLKNIDDKFNSITKECLSSYRKIFDINEPFYYTEHNNLLKYTDSQYFRSHYDGDTGSKRSISLILYLNDEYDGGEIEFVNFDIKIKPSAGSLFIFPSNYAYRHIAHPIKSGTKYAIVTWIHDRIQ
jgi:predicted 2-oxoglutarate/Fe(II)-dependent dioxygenase YbiX